MQLFKTLIFPQNTTDIINGDFTLYDWLRGFDREADIGEIEIV